MIPSHLFPDFNEQDYESLPPEHTCLTEADFRDNSMLNNPIFFLFNPAPSEEFVIRKHLDQAEHEDEYARFDHANYYIPWPEDRTDDGTQIDVDRLAKRMWLEQIPFRSGAAIFVDRNSLTDGKALVVEQGFDEERNVEEIGLQHRFSLAICATIVCNINVANMELLEWIENEPRPKPQL